MNERIRALLVDDEPLARQKLRTLLASETDIKVVGECDNGVAAVEMVLRLHPDLIFLDIQMPGLDGFETLEAFGPDWVGAVIFVTAHDKHAIQAFEVHALDYVLKPFDRKRFQHALARARRHIELNRTGQVNRQLLSLLEERKEQKRIVVRNAGHILIVRCEEIDWVGAEGNYVNLHVGNNSYLHRETVSKMEARLDRRIFARIHRSTIVNVERIKKLRPLFHGDYEVTLTSGARLNLSRSYRAQLERALGQAF